MFFGLSPMVSTRTSMHVSAALAIILAAGLGGCGVRSALEAPPKAKADGTATSADAADPGPGSAVKPKPHRDFPLDSLVR